MQTGYVLSDEPNRGSRVQCYSHVSLQGLEATLPDLPLPGGGGGGALGWRGGGGKSVWRKCQLASLLFQARWRLHRTLLLYPEEAPRSTHLELCTWFLPYAGGWGCRGSWG